MSKGGGGGAGGAGGTIINYHYYSTFALGLGVGPAARVIKIWADAKLIYDATGLGNVADIDLKFRFYDGSEDQEKDDIMNDAIGEAANVAYKGLAYILFEDFPLDEFGRRIPNMTVLLAYQSDESYNVIEVSNLSSCPFDSYDTRFMVWDRYGSRVILTDLTGADDERGTYIYDYPSMEQIGWVDSIEIAEVFGGNHAGAVLDVSDLSGHFYGTVLVGNSVPIVKFDKNTLKAVNAFPDDFSTSSSLTNSETRFALVTRLAVSSPPILSQYPIDYIFTIGQFAPIGILRNVNDEMSYIWGASESFSNVAAVVARSDEGTGYWLALTTGLGGQIDIKRAKCTTPITSYTDDTGSFEILGETVANVEDVGTILPSEIGITSGSFNVLDGAVFDYEDESIIFVVGEQNSSDSAANAIVKWNPTDGIVWYTNIGMGVGSSGGVLTQKSTVRMNMSDGVYAWVGYTKLVRVNTSDGSLIELRTDLGDAGTWNLENRDRQAYDGDYSGSILFTHTGGITKIGLALWNRFGIGDTSLDEVVSDISNACGLDDTQIDVSDLTSDAVHGAIFSEQAPARSFLEDLANAYFFDAVDTDGQIKFVKRGGSSVVTVPQQDLGETSPGAYWNQTRIQDFDVAGRINFIYLGKETDYQQSNQLSKRITNPTPAIQNFSEVSITVPLVFSAEEAKRIAEQRLYESWTSRSTYESMFGWKYLPYDPTDIITVQLDSGSTFVTRINSKDTSGDKVSKVTMLEEDQTNYSSIVSASDGLGFQAQTIAGRPRTKLFVFDIPLLRDTDDAGGSSSRYYVAVSVSSNSLNWNGATIFKSDDLNNYSAIDSVVVAASWGAVLDTIGDTDRPFSVNFTDTITIRPFYGAANLSSITYTQLWAGANTLIIGTEIIQFKTATENDDGTYTLSGLLRGRRGTDTLTGDHVSGEEYVLVNTSWIFNENINLDNLNTPRAWKGVTFGTLNNTAVPVVKSLSGKDLKPWAPVFVLRVDESNGDITISWTRRTRIGGGLMDGTGTVPLSEASEAYEVDILDASGGNVLRTLTSDTESVTYSAADISTDFGSVFPTTLYCKVYQMSGTITTLRGFAYEWELAA